MRRGARNARRSIVVFSLIALAACCGCGDDDEDGTIPDLSVHFADANLEAVVRVEIDKPTGKIFPADLAGLETLLAPDQDIDDLGGIQYCVDLKQLDLHNNSITNLAPLAQLTDLTALDLENNSIQNVGPLAGLTNLTSLKLGDNTIDVITAIGNLTNLLVLTLYDNRIIDLGPLATLSQLTVLRADGNYVVDLSALETLTNLTNLQLNSNDIQDISALVDNCLAGGLGIGDSVFLEDNPLSSQALSVDIPYLESNGVDVTF